MSTAPMGPGWWMASDGRWYPPASPPPLGPTPSVSTTTGVLERRQSTGASFTLVGGILMVGGALLPWVTIRIGTAVVSRNAMQLGPNFTMTIVGPFLLVMGALTAVVGLTRLAAKSTPVLLNGSTILTGLASGVFVALNYPIFPSTLSNFVTATGGSAEVAYGYWVCAAGCAFSVLGGILVGTKQENRSALNAILVGAIALVTLLIAATAVGIVWEIKHHANGSSATSPRPASVGPASTMAIPAGHYIPATTPVYEFYSPSQNISCEIDYGTIGSGTTRHSVFCETISPPQSVEMSADGSLQTCSGMQCLGNAGLNTPTLAYGDTAGVGPFRCTSAVAAMTCTVTGGKGFSISRAGIAPRIPA